MLRVGFARWRSHLPSGGNRYDAELIRGMGEHGVELHEHAVEGPWPLPRKQDRRRLAQLLGAEERWLMGNIVASAVPELIVSATGAGQHITVLMHYFPADDPALLTVDRQWVESREAEAVAAASRIVVPSEWAAREVARRYGRDDAVVARPGVDPAPLASTSAGTPQLLWLGRLTATKDPLTLIDALARITDLDWRIRLVGPAIPGDDADALARARVVEHGLEDRVTLTGELTGDALESAWAGSDLLVHTSRAETYGMVVSEALARGIPSIVVDGTGAAEAQAGVGAQFPPGDAAALADQLRGWLTDDALRHRWRADAEAARTTIPTWQDMVGAVASAFTDGS
ncbi:MAG: glycosyltransferase family 4 protein [Propionibacterium sp.]|nr:glycosyltransferase family 4 protein [Propionibacterium sp.]